ncbi:hypothetical protein AB0395_03105 [Streptosporangium sp. NPDC051023]|uniref:EF-hand domain-containing protein n=1 Tax=Streptosporangium sp. NPDC051023 TaxID=3155410 RepID=UPI00344C161B
MTTAPLERVRLRFAMLDTDANGYLEADDFERLASRIIEAVAEPAGSPKAVAVLEGHRRYWRGLRGSGETGDGGRVGLHEYIAHVAGPEHFDDVIREYAESLAALADVDDDGFIEYVHFVACLQAAGFHPTRIDALFEGLDPHGAGRVTTRAWVASIKDFYGSQRTDIPAQRLLAAPSTS